MNHFDFPSLRYDPETAEKYKKIDGRLMVMPAVQSKMVEITRVSPPLESSFCWLDDGQKQFCISTPSSPSSCQRWAYHFFAQKYHIFSQSMIIPDAFLAPLMELDPSPRLSCVGLYHVDDFGLLK